MKLTSQFYFKNLIDYLKRKSGNNSDRKKLSTYQILISQIGVAIGIRRINGQSDAVRKYRHKDEPFEGSAN